MKQVASLRYGVIFKKAFCDVMVFKGFVRDILGIQLDIDKVETEKVFDTVIGSVKTQFDLFAEDKKKRIIVDIQHQRHIDHYDRFLHYHCVALLEQIKSSSDYRANLKVYTIVVLTSGDKYKKDVLITDFSPRDLSGNKVNEIAHKIIFLCPKYVNENTPESYREWLEAIEDSLDGEVDESHYKLAEIQQVFRHIERDDISPDERARMIEEYHLEEAIDEGVKKAKKTIIKNMLAKNISMATIVEVTNLTANEIEDLLMNNDE
ncbi:MAG: PD-(D/E)XK nuclease family transposase [Methylococcales bacterium]|nr:PD-(D/E)XK nuclease family transposase [Methylococcales bacterium]